VTSCALCFLNWIKQFRDEPKFPTGGINVKRIIIESFTQGLVTLLACLLLTNCNIDPQKAKQAYLDSGRRYMKKHDYQAASIQFKNALKIDPRFAEAFYQLGLANEALQNWQEAYKDYNQAVELSPARVDVHLKLAQVEIMARQYTQAKDVLSSVLKLDPNNAGAYELLGTCNLAQKQPEAARDALARAVALSPNNPSAVTNLGLVEITMRQFLEAEQHLKDAVKLNPHDPSTYSNLANLYQLLREPAQEVDAFERGIQQNPDADRLYLALAAILDAQDNTQEAKQVLNRLAARKPKSSSASIAIGDFYLARHAMPDALSQYQRAMQLAPGDVNPMNRMVSWDLENGKVKDADTWNMRALQKRPGDPDARLARGQILLLEGKLQEAILHLRKEITEERDAPLPHHLLAMALWQQQNVADAKSEFQTALRFDPAYLPSERGLTELLLSTGELGSAQDLGLRMVQHHPGDFTARMLLTTIFLRQGNAAGARANALAARNIAPKDPGPVVDLALADAMEKKWAQAESEFSAALSEDPHSLPALTQFSNYWMQRGQPARAMALVKQFLASYPGDAQGHALLGSLALADKQNELAAGELEQACKLDPELVQPHVLLGQLYQRQNQLGPAIQQYEAALAQQSTSAYLQTAVANLYSDLGKTDLAKRHYQAALAIDPNYGPAAGNLAWLEAQNGGNLDVALGLAEKAKQVLPDPAPITDTLAWIQYKKGVYSSAVPLFEECVKKAPSSPVYHYHLGLALLANGQKGEGRAQLEAALRLNLSGDDAKKARQALGQQN
jgi:tetratricopeptide (TPR) repeat protein